MNPKHGITKGLHCIYSLEMLEDLSQFLSLWYLCHMGVEKAQGSLANDQSHQSLHCFPTIFSLIWSLPCLHTKTRDTDEGNRKISAQFVNQVSDVCNA